VKIDSDLDTTAHPLEVDPLNVKVLVAVPIPQFFTYQWPFKQLPVFGQRLIVPWGNRTRIALTYAQDMTPLQFFSYELKSVIACLDNGSLLDEAWQRLVEFAAKYYHHPLGMIALEALPKALRVLNARGAEPVMVQKAHQHGVEVLAQRQESLSAPVKQIQLPVLNCEQQNAVADLSPRIGFSANLLYGITGSGKTEVYLRVVAERLLRSEQVLVLLPEINLTPAALTLYKTRLAPHRVVVLHSNLAELSRTKSWFEAAMGAADVVIATRLGVLTPMPRLGFIVVDEEHDASYKQQDGIRYNARDLALMQAKQRDIPIVLGSATPSLETWLKAEQGTINVLKLTQRAVLGASLPKVELINTANFPPKEGLSEPILQALQANFLSGKQSIVF
jgi:primosomal protein N' (replication factor Y)